MKPRSKRYLVSQSKIDKNKSYSIEEGIKLIKEEGVTKFDQGIEVHIRLGINPKKSDQLIRGICELPHGTGKEKRIIAFVAPEQEAEAKEAGADIIGSDDIIQQIKQTKKIDFDVAIATPAMMKKVGPIAKILGQKGLMPNPKTETVGPDVKKMITGIKAGKFSFKNDDSANVHALMGKMSFDDNKLVENIKSFIEVLKKSKPASAKGTYIKKITICSSMGPSVNINV